MDTDLAVKVRPSNVLYDAVFIILITLLVTLITVLTIAYILGCIYIL